MHFATYCSNIVDRGTRGMVCMYVRYMVEDKDCLRPGQPLDQGGTVCGRSLNSPAPSAPHLLESAGGGLGPWRLGGLHGRDCSVRR
jgi:hypothetical protein